MTATAATRLNHSRTLSRQRVASGRLVGRALLLVVVVVATALFYVWCRLEMVRVGYEQSRLAQTIAELEKANEELRGEAARLKSPERIERLARERLGLSYPSPEQIRILDLSVW